MKMHFAAWKHTITTIFVSFFYVSNINIFHSLQFLLINVIKYISFPTAQTDQKIL